MWIHVNYMYEKNNFPSPLQLNRICYAHFLLKCEIIINLNRICYAHFLLICEISINFSGENS